MKAAFTDAERDAIARARRRPLIDAHHHLWEPAEGNQPWLRPGVLIPFRYGDYTTLRRRFMPHDYRAVTAGWNVVGSVTIETEWDETRLLEETRWIDGIARAWGIPLAHVARTFLHFATAEAELAEHARSPLVRGIRHKPRVVPSPEQIEWGAPASMSDPAWRRGYAGLARHGLHFELQAPWWHVDELLDLISAHPATPVVINHTFLPADRSDVALSGWRAALRRVASAPQVTIKISGLGLPDVPWAYADNRSIIRDTLAIFGAERCMFASNFPVDGLCGTFDGIFDGFAAATADLDETWLEALFAGNARRVYRLA